METKKVYRLRCSACSTIMGCFNSERKEKEQFCVDRKTKRSCLDVCPNPTQKDEPDLCEKHFEQQIKRIQERIKHLEE